MRGALFQYARGLQAFESGDGPKKLIQLGGLSDGLLACEYVPRLANALEARGWSVVQPVLRSSYMQFGFGSLDNDVEDVVALVAALQARGAGRVAICGHSTGSQIAAHVVRTAPPGTIDLLSHVIFQAGVSDRQTDDAAEQFERTTLLAAAAACADPAAFLPRAAHWAPMTAQRYLDLFAAGGRDDYFSADLVDGALDANFAQFGPRGVKALVAFSEMDEYMPPSVDAKVLGQRLAASLGRCGAPRALSIVVPGGDHALSGADAAEAFVRAVSSFLQDEDDVPGAILAT